MATPIVILGYQAWSFKDDDGKARSGATVHYLNLDMAPPEDGAGLFPIKMTVTAELSRQIGPVPGFYSAEFGQRMSGGKAVSVLTSLDFVSSAVVSAAEKK